jgi:hypothetical protein
MKELPQLEACPHCGSAAYFGDVDGIPAIRCDDCEAACLALYKTEDDWGQAAEAWNKRTHRSAPSRAGVFVTWVRDDGPVFWRIEACHEQGKRWRSNLFRCAEAPVVKPCTPGDGWNYEVVRVPAPETT